jgi:protein-tyrosine phosphatase
MIDLHCHILPGVDDGPEKLEGSLGMAEIAVQNGIHTIIATPHSHNGVYINDWKKILSATANLQEHLDKEKIALTVLPGLEIHLNPDMTAIIENGKAGTLNNTGKYALIELPYQTIPDGLKNEIFNMKILGITPVIAHPERNMDIQDDFSILYDIVESGVLCQLTANSISGKFGTKTKNCAFDLLKARLAHIIASDAHTMNHRPPVLQDARDIAAEVLEDENEANDMVVKTPELIINGKRVTTQEPKKPSPKKRRWFFWK